MVINFKFKHKNQFPNCAIASKINSRLANPREALRVEEITQLIWIRVELRKNNPITRESSSGSSIPNLRNLEIHEKRKKNYGEKMRINDRSLVSSSIAPKCLEFPKVREKMAQLWSISAPKSHRMRKSRSKRVFICCWKSYHSLGKNPA